MRNSNYLLLLMIFSIMHISMNGQKSNKPNLLDVQYKVVNSNNYPIMMNKMDGFEIDRNNFLFIDLTYNSIFRGLIQCGYERKINNKNTYGILFGISFVPDPLAWAFNNTDDFFVKKKSKLANAIHDRTWAVGLAQSNNIPGLMLGAEHSYGLNEDVLHGFSLKSGCMYYNYRPNMLQNLEIITDDNKRLQVKSDQKARIDYFQIYGGLSYKKLIKQGVYFDGGINIGFKMIRYNIKVSPLLDVYKIKPISIIDPNEVYYSGSVQANEAFVPDPNGQIPYQFTPTILFHGRLGFGFNTKKSKR
jgi:hypothetical protein